MGLLLPNEALNQATVHSGVTGVQAFVLTLRITIARLSALIVDSSNSTTGLPWLGYVCVGDISNSYSGGRGDAFQLRSFFLDLHESATFLAWFPSIFQNL